METPKPSTSNLRAFVDALLAASPTPSGAKRSARTPSGAKQAPKAPSPPRTEPIAPGAWRLSTRWTSEILVAVATRVVCDNCQSEETSSQPFIYLQRFHPLFGIHREALSVHSPRHIGLPRKVETIESRVMFCRHCFAGATAASAQLRLPFDLSTPATFTDAKGQFHITDLFNSLNAPSAEGGVERANPLSPPAVVPGIPRSHSLSPIEGAVREAPAEVK